MKKILLISILLGIFSVSCNKDNKISGENNASDSLTNENTMVENLEKTTEAGKVIFSKDNNAILIFDLLENTGKIKIDGKEIALNQLTFTENIYQIEGENISIVAENGDFQDMTTECIEGSFPKITITYNGQTLDIQDIKTKECPEHHNIID